MKLLLTSLLLASFTAFGQVREEPPPELKGAKYKVTLRNGKVFEATARNYKLVPRVKNPKPEGSTKIIEKEVEKVVYSRYQLGLYIGSGPTDIKLEQGDNEATVTSQKDIVAGVGIGVNFSPHWGVQGLLLTNETVLFGAHLNFGKL